MKRNHPTFVAGAVMALALTGPSVALSADLVTREAEDGTLGANWTTSTDGGTQYITISGTGAGGNPGSAARVATYSVTFPVEGTYELYGRVRVGSGGANDDSFFYGNGFGAKSPTSDADWILVNSVNVGGFTDPNDVVAGSGSAGVSVWKWINLSQYTGTAGEAPITFTVPAGNLNQTFEIGAREDGFEIDKFAFGTSGTAFTVANLDSGLPPSPPTNAFPGPDGMAIHRFSPLANGINADGANPAAGLAVADGVLIGTTFNGGLQVGGTAFFVSPDGNEFGTSHTFGGAPDAGHPMGESVISGNQFFSTTLGGGANDTGAVLLGQTNSSLSVLRSFSGVHNHTATNSGGASPSAFLALAGSTLYGTATAGGVAGNGTIFSVNTNGATFSVLHDFSLIDSQAGTNVDGAAPWGGLIRSGDTLYGTSSGGGAGGNGVVFSIKTNGTAFTALHSFSPMDTITATNTDGAIPFGGLALSGSTLYGTTSAGGHGGSGTAFSVGTNGTGFSVLHHFTATDSTTATNGDGASPCAPLLVSGQSLYGTAAKGGEAAAGTVFSLSLDGAQFSTLHSFAALGSNGTNRYGAFPVAPLVQFGHALYGTTFGGGPGAAGTVFTIALAAPPAVITNIIRNGSGGVDLLFVGGPDSTNVIQATGSLTPPVVWQNVSTNVADSSGEWQFTDGASNATRFYRSYAP